MRRYSYLKFTSLLILRGPYFDTRITHHPALCPTKHEGTEVNTVLQQISHSGERPAVDLLEYESLKMFWINDCILTTNVLFKSELYLNRKRRNAEKFD